MKVTNIKIREVESFEEMDKCLELQREVFSFTDLDVSPRRHLVVTKRSGGFTLGAYDEGKIVGLAITVPAFFGAKRAFYSHMAAVKAEYQSFGIGGQLKWAQRARALSEQVKYIKWTFQPVQSRNAYFNLEKLGAVIREYVPNFYGTGFSNSGSSAAIESDRVYAEWDLESDKVAAIVSGRDYQETRPIAKSIAVPDDWNSLLASDPSAAMAEQDRIRTEFQSAFSEGLVCSGFDRDEKRPTYQFYESL